MLRLSQASIKATVGEVVSVGTVGTASSSSPNLLEFFSSSQSSPAERTNASPPVPLLSGTSIAGPVALSTPPAFRVPSDTSALSAARRSAGVARAATCSALEDAGPNKVASTSSSTAPDSASAPRPMHMTSQALNPQGSDCTPSGSPMAESSQPSLSSRFARGRYSEAIEQQLSAQQSQSAQQTAPIEAPAPIIDSTLTQSTLPSTLGDIQPLFTSTQLDSVGPHSSNPLENSVLEEVGNCNPMLSSPTAARDPVIGEQLASPARRMEPQTSAPSRITNPSISKAGSGLGRKLYGLAHTPLRIGAENDEGAVQITRTDMNSRSGLLSVGRKRKRELSEEVCE